MTGNRPNVLLIVMDTARANDVIGQSHVLPNVHELADEGTLFTNAFTTAPWTLPSHASIFTGEYTADHGTHAGSKSFDLDGQPLAAWLSEEGYRTVAYSNNPWVSPDFGFDRGFDDFKVGWKVLDGGADTGAIALESEGLRDQLTAIGKELLRKGGHRTFVNALYAKFLQGRYDDGARFTNWRIKRWLSEHATAEAPFFAFVNYLEPHLEYDPPGEYYEQFLPEDVDPAEAAEVNQDAWSYICGTAEMDERDFEILSGLYRGELAYLDERIGQVIDHLADLGVLDETMIVIAGDHGENIGDHGLMDHQYCLYDTLLHVPLLVRYPEQFPEGERCDALVELRDLFPSLLDVAGVDPRASETTSTRTLQGSLRDGGRDHVVGQYVHPQPSMDVLEKRVGTLPESVREYDRALRSIRTTEWKLIEGSDGSVELFDVGEDPAEQVDVSADHPEVVDRLVSTLDEELGTFDAVDGMGDAEMPSSTKDRLEDLGYLQ